MAYVELKNSKTNEVIYTSSILKGHLIEDYLRSVLTDSSNIEIKILTQNILLSLPLEEALEYIENNWVDKTKFQSLCWRIYLKPSVLETITTVNNVIVVKTHIGERFGFQRDLHTLNYLNTEVTYSSSGMLYMEYRNSASGLHLRIKSLSHLKKIKIQKEDCGINITAVKIIKE